MSSNYRNDGLDNPFSPNSGSVTWDHVEQMCERSDAVLAYDSDGSTFSVDWCDGTTDRFSVPQAAVNAIRAMEEA